MRISDWSSDVCSSDLTHVVIGKPQPVDLSKVLTASDEPAARMVAEMLEKKPQTISSLSSVTTSAEKILLDLSAHNAKRSEEHTSELQSLMRISYAVFCLKKKTQTQSTQ